MFKLVQLTLILNIFLLLTSCGGGNSTTTREDPEEFNINGTFVGKDNSDRDANVAVDSANKTIDIALTTSTETIDLEGEIILTSVASTGKKMATGDITFNVDLMITKSNLAGFSVGLISYGTIIKSIDDVNGNKYTCAFNFTNKIARGTSEADSDWSMSGTKSQ